VVAAPDGVGDDLLDGGAVEAQGDVEPVVGRAAAAGVLGDVDLAGGGADVDEVAQVADALGRIGSRRAVGHALARVAVGRGGGRQAEDGRVADVEPVHARVGGGEDPADARGDDDVVAVDRVDGEVDDPRERPLRVGGGQAVAGLQQAVSAADVVAPGD